MYRFPSSHVYEKSSVDPQDRQNETEIKRSNFLIYPRQVPEMLRLQISMCIGVLSENPDDSRYG